jgi:hypothetical protein
MKMSFSEVNPGMMSIEATFEEVALARDYFDFILTMEWPKDRAALITSRKEEFKIAIVPPEGLLATPDVSDTGWGHIMAVEQPAA